MNKVPVDIFHLVRAKAVLRKTLAFCGLVTILLTASCAPHSSGSKDVSPAKVVDNTKAKLSENIEVETPNSNTGHSESRTSDTGVAVKSTEETTGTSENPSVPTPSVSAPTASAPAPAIQAPSVAQTSFFSQGGGGAGDAGGGSNDRPSYDEIRKTVERLNSQYWWAILPTYEVEYKDLSGKAHNQFKVSSGNSPELRDLIMKLRDELGFRKDPGHRLKFEFKEKGACESQDGKKEAAAKICDPNAPVCLSLEYIQAMTPKASLEQSLKSLIMHEVAHQYCANEEMAKQVERYYDLPAIRNFELATGIQETFYYMLKQLTLLKTALTTGYIQITSSKKIWIDTEEVLCRHIEKGQSVAQILQNQVAGTGFIRDPEGSEELPRVTINSMLSGMTWYCEKEAPFDEEEPYSVKPGDRRDLLNHVNAAIRVFDQLAQEFSVNSGMIAHDFSKHLWPYKAYDPDEKPAHHLK